MERFKKMKLLVISLLIVVEALYFVSCESSSPFAPNGSEAGGTTALEKKGKGKGGEPDPFPNSDFLMVRRREDDENGVSSAVIGPQGGVLTHALHSIVIPAGALDQPTLISMWMPVSDTLLFGFGPEGLHFNTPVQLVLDYNHAYTSGLDETQFNVVFLDSFGGVAENIPSTVDIIGEDVIGDTNHFSRYAIKKFR